MLDPLRILFVSLVLSSSIAHTKANIFSSDEVKVEKSENSESKLVEVFAASEQQQSTPMLRGEVASNDEKNSKSGFWERLTGGFKSDEDAKEKEQEAKFESFRIAENATVSANPDSQTDKLSEESNRKKRRKDFSGVLGKASSADLDTEVVPLLMDRLLGLGEKSVETSEKYSRPEKGKGTGSGDVELQDGKKLLDGLVSSTASSSTVAGEGGKQVNRLFDHYEKERQEYSNSVVKSVTSSKFSSTLSSTTSTGSSMGGEAEGGARLEKGADKAEKVEKEEGTEIAKEGGGGGDVGEFVESILEKLDDMDDKGGKFNETLEKQEAVLETVARVGKHHVREKEEKEREAREREEEREREQKEQEEIQQREKNEKSAGKNQFSGMSWDGGEGFADPVELTLLEMLLGMTSSMKRASSLSATGSGASNVTKSAAGNLTAGGRSSEPQSLDERMRRGEKEKDAAKEKERKKGKEREAKGEEKQEVEDVARLIDSQDNEYVISSPGKGSKMQMQEDLTLISDIVKAIVAAGIGGLICGLLGQPLILGYLAAGMVVGPGGFGLIHELVQVETLAQFGVMFLLFALGIEFDLSKMNPGERAVSLGGGAVQIIVAMLIGAVVSYSKPQGIFIGAFLSMSSTTVVLKCLMDSNMLGTDHGQIMLGTLILQDCALGLLLAVMPALASKSSSFLSISFALCKETALLLIFCLGAYVVAKLLIPPYLRMLVRVSRNNVELFQLGVLAVCLCTALLSQNMGLSLEVGAFVSGLMISGDKLAERSLHQIEPIRNVFAALFLSAIGMVMHPLFLWQHKGILLGALMFVFFGKALIVAGVVRCFGYNMGVSASVGIALAQVGEFSFVLLSKAQALALIRHKVYLLLMGTTALSLVLTPFAFKLVPFILRFLGEGPHGAAHKARVSSAGPGGGPTATGAGSSVAKVVVHGFAAGGMAVLRSVVGTDGASRGKAGAHQQKVAHPYQHHGSELSGSTLRTRGAGLKAHSSGENLSDLGERERERGNNSSNSGGGGGTHNGTLSEISPRLLGGGAHSGFGGSHTSLTSSYGGERDVPSSFAAPGTSPQEGGVAIRSFQQRSLSHNSRNNNNSNVSGANEHRKSIEEFERGEWGERGGGSGGKFISSVSGLSPEFMLERSPRQLKQHLTGNNSSNNSSSSGGSFSGPLLSSDSSHGVSPSGSHAQAHNSSNNTTGKVEKSSASGNNSGGSYSSSTNSSHFQHHAYRYQHQEQNNSESTGAVSPGSAGGSSSSSRISTSPTSSMFRSRKPQLGLGGGSGEGKWKVPRELDHR